MTSKIQITDEMVERACEAAYVADGRPYERFANCHDSSKKSWRTLIRAGLEAVLNPPEEPEIPVSEGMERAGLAAYYQCDEYHYQLRYSAHDSMARAYRAMEKARRKEEACAYCSGRPKPWWAMPCGKCNGTGKPAKEVDNVNETEQRKVERREGGRRSTDYQERPKWKLFKHSRKTDPAGPAVISDTPHRRSTDPGFVGERMPVIIPDPLGYRAHFRKSDPCFLGVARHRRKDDPK